jgi:hypothetical protein
VVAADAVGNVAAPVKVTFMLDREPPTFTSMEAPAAVRDGTVTVTFVADDGFGSGVKNVTCNLRAVALVERNVDEGEAGEWNMCESPISYNGLEEGRWLFSAVAVDIAGHASQVEQLTIYQDTIPPVASVAAGPSQRARVPSKVTFNLTDASPQPAGTASEVTQWKTLVQKVTEEQFQALASGSASQGMFEGGAGTAYAIMTTTGEEGAVLKELGSGDVGEWAACGNPCVYKASRDHWRL